MIQLFSDENFPGPTINRLRQAGIDVLRVQDVGLRGEPDERVLGFAIQDRRAVVTENRKDFIKLHRRVKDHWGIIVCTADDPDKVAQKIVDAIKDKNDLQNQLVRINRSS